MSLPREEYRTAKGMDLSWEIYTHLVVEFFTTCDKDVGAGWNNDHGDHVT